MDVQNLVDPDILELKKKHWNISYSTTENFKPELNKILFEIKSGLKDFRVIPIKEHITEEGVDTRNHIELDGNTWNISNQVSKIDFRNDDSVRLSKAKDNSSRYWKTNSELRYKEMPFPIPEEKKKIEIIRYFKKYHTPIQKNIDFYNTMSKIKEDSFIEREKAEQKVKYKNPGLDKCPEKINALVHKEMYDIYKYKYNELTGKLNKEELKKKQREKNKFKWSDKDLANKIVAINKISNSFIKDNNKDNYNPTNTDGNIPLHNIYSKVCYSQDKKAKARKILFPLVSKGTEILLEEEKIKEKINEEYKKKKKRESILNFGKNKKIITDKFVSKFPLNNTDYENFINNSKYDDSEEKNLNKSATAVNLKNYWSELSKDSKCGEYFLEAYNKIADKEIRRLYSVEKKNREEITFKYSHPGAYREFTFEETVNDDENYGDGYQKDKNNKKNVTKVYLWSCCMNNDKNSRGCKKISIKNFRWIYNP